MKADIEQLYPHVNTIHHWNLNAIIDESQVIKIINRS